MDCKCYFLDCNKKGRVLDDVEIAPQQFEKHMVCKKHVGRKLENIARKGKNSSNCVKLKPAQLN